MVLGEDKPVGEIEREDCRRVAAVICALPPNATKRLKGLPLEQAAVVVKDRALPPLHPKTATKYLNNLSALFEWAAREGYVSKNPARQLGMVAPGSRTEKSRLPFTVQQLNQIFHSSLYGHCAEPLGSDIVAGASGFL